MNARILVIGIVVVLWVLALRQVLASTVFRDATLEWQIAGSVPALMIAFYITGLLLSWLRHR